MERPKLERGLDEQVFRSFYYRKEELAAFCRANGLSPSGGKLELADRAAHYLATGEALPARTAARVKPEVGELTADTEIEPDFVCSEKHRAFFKAQLGKGFSFNVAFQKWLKANTGKTYAQAVEAYRQIAAEKKGKKTSIDPQFEYNAYIRAFYEGNPGKKLGEAIACWKYKKGRPGHNCYEPADLAALEE